MSIVSLTAPHLALGANLQLRKLFGEVSLEPLGV